MTNSFGKARSLYAESNQEENFLDQLLWHLENGIVYSTPDAFMLAHLSKDEKGVCNWFVEVGVGKLTTLLSALRVGTPKICFCRFKMGHIKKRTYDMRRFVHLAALTEKKVT